MKGGNKIWSTIVDYFLVLGSIIGVGFASGKEIFVFFFNFGKFSILGLISFALLYIYLFFIIQHISKKLKLNSYDQFNSYIFGKLCKLTNIVMLVNFSITSAGMLAGADYMFKNFFGIGFKIPSLVLSLICFSLLLGGIDKIKIMANLIIPIMIFVIVINSFYNINPQNVNFNIVKANEFMAVYYGLLFGVNNFVVAVPVLFETKLKSKGKLFVILTICLIILLNILLLASNKFCTDMPMFELSKNVGNWFYYIYFATLLSALFSTLTICSFNTQTIILKGKKNNFVSLLIVLFNLILSNFSYDFIVNYLYVFSSILSGILIVILIIIILIKLIKFKSKKIINKK